MVSESGTGMMWAGKAISSGFTPRRNDPASHAAGDRTYLCDDDSGDVWTPTQTDAARRLTSRRQRGRWAFNLSSIPPPKGPRTASQNRYAGVRPGEDSDFVDPQRRINAAKPRRSLHM